jgi:hypothetical protein
MKYRSILGVIALGTGLCVGSFAQTAKQDAKNAGTDTKNAAKDTGRAVKHGAQTTGRKVKHGTHKAAQGAANKTQ